LQKFHALDDPAFAGVRAYRTEKEVFGRKRTIVITRSRALLRGQIRGIRQHLSKSCAPCGISETNRPQP